MQTLFRPALISARISRMAIVSAKRSRGRPKLDSEAVNVRLLRQQLDQLDAWIIQQPDAPTRPEAIRRLIEAGLHRKFDR